MLHILHTPCAFTYDNLLVYIAIILHLMSSTQLEMAMHSPSNYIRFVNITYKVQVRSPERTRSALESWCFLAVMTTWGMEDEE